MALLHSFEKSGNFLFKWRGQIPVVLILLAIPVMATTDITFLSKGFKLALTILCIIVSLSGFLVRAYTIGTTPKGTSGRNTTGQVAEVLNTMGIYSAVRHPLYVGNYLMWIGIVMFTFNFYFVLIVSLAYWLYYERIMYAEERFLEKKFGKIYLDWSVTVPAFIPDFSSYMSSNVKFSVKSVLRREYSGVLATVLCFALIDQYRFLLKYEVFGLNRISTLVFLITLVIVLVLRTLKHSTTILNEDGRS